MQPQLKALYKQLEEQREEFSEWVMNAPVPLLHQRADATQWSAAQVFHHLLQVDQQVLLGLEKKLNSGKPLRSLRKITRFRYFLLNLLLRLPIKFKAPAIIREVPAMPNVTEVARKWQEARKQLFSILEAYPAENLQKEVYFHPRAGMLTLPQTLRFMYEHAEHHRRQLRRLLS